MKKSITEFLAGGLFAFTMFVVSGFVIYFAQAQGLFDFVRSLAVASADISSYRSSKADAPSPEEADGGLKPEPAQEQDRGFA